MEEDKNINLERFAQLEREKLEAQYSEKLEDIKSCQLKKQDIMKERILEEAEERINNIAAGNEAAIEAALESLKNEHEERIHSLEYELSWTKKQKETIELAMEEVTSQNEKHNKSSNELARTIEYIKKENSFNLLRIISKSLSQRNISRQLVESRQKETEQILKELKREEESKHQSYQGKINVITKHLNHFIDREKILYDLLVNNNRDALLQHKLKSRDVSFQLDKIILKRKDLEDKQGVAEDETKQMEDEVYQIEKQIQEHSQTSAIQEGRVTILHAGKKRRLDEEYEHLLGNINSQREKITLIDSQIKNVLKNKEEEDNTMRELERSLVEILVGQQKN